MTTTTQRRSWLGSVVERHGIAIRFMSVVLGLLGGFSLLLLWDPFKQAVLTPFTVLVTRVAAILLGLVGSSEADATVLTYGAFTVDIATGCNGDIVHAILVAGVLGFPATWRARAWGLGIGTVLVFLLNQARIVTLCLIGVHAPAWFENAHVYIGQVIVVIGTLFIWIGWVERFASPRRR